MQDFQETYQPEYQLHQQLGLLQAELTNEQANSKRLKSKINRLEKTVQSARNLIAFFVCAGVFTMLVELIARLIK
jgi:uncharacterized protein YlxW (UPF0749 family)